MPAIQSLQWFDIDDFSAGVWDVKAAYNQFAAPAKAFVTLQDYQPLKGGGCRPWFQTTAIDLSGVGSGEVPMGVFARNGAVRTGTGGTGNQASDILLVTMKPADDKFRIYRLDNTVVTPAWSLRFTSAAESDSSHKPVSFAYFQDLNGVEWYLMAIQTNGSATGLYKMQVDYTVASNTGNDGAVTKINAFNGPVVVSQARIMVGSGNRIEYGDVGLTTFTAGTSGFVEVAPNRADNVIAGLSGIEPSDLIVAKIAAPWVEISGDITSVSTPIREMGDDHHLRAMQQLPKTPNGVAFIEPTGRIFETDGRNFRSLSNQLGPRSFDWDNDMVAAGTMAFLNGYLYIPGVNDAVNGIVYDYETGALFQISAVNPVFNWSDAAFGQMYSLNHDPTTPSLMQTDIFGGSRVTTGILQTVPYADQNGRNIDIREVQLYVLTNDNTEFKVELIDENGNSVATRYALVPVARRDMVKLQFPATKSTYLSVKITPRTLNDLEAPTFERIRVGFGMNNLVRE